VQRAAPRDGLIPLLYLPSRKLGVCGISNTCDVFRCHAARSEEPTEDKQQDGTLSCKESCPCSRLEMRCMTTGAIRDRFLLQPFGWDADVDDIDTTGILHSLSAHHRVCKLQSVCKDPGCIQAPMAVRDFPPGPCWRSDLGAAAQTKCPPTCPGKPRNTKIQHE
jgi:hypothetical protein